MSAPRASRFPGRHSRPARLFEITRAVRQLKPHLVQSAHFYTNLYVAVAGRYARLPTIGAIRSNGIADVEGLSRVLGRYSLRWPHLVVANSQAGIDHAIRLGISADRLWLLQNVIDTSAFQASDRLPGRVFRIAAIARLAHEKRIDRLLRVTAIARQRMGRDLHLTIAGAGPLRSSLETLAQDLELGGCVTFAGPMADVRPLLAESDCLALTSDTEGTPNVLLEAMAMGCPVVATDVGGVPILVNDGQTGFVVAREDESGFADCLVRIETDAGLAERVGREARAVVDRAYGLARLPSELERLYRTLVPDARRRPH